MNPALAAPRGPGLSGTALKRLACLSMLVDHLGASLLENGLFRCSAIDPRLVGLDQLLRLAGRLEFPIVKDTTPNMMNPRLYTTSYNKP